MSRNSGSSARILANATAASAGCPSTLASWATPYHASNDGGVSRASRP